VRCSGWRCWSARSRARAGLARAAPRPRPQHRSLERFGVPMSVVTAEQAESTHTLARSRLSDVRPSDTCPFGPLTPAVQRLSLRCSTAASRPSIPNSNGSCGSTAGRRKLNLDAVDLPFEANRWPSDVRMLWGPARAVVRCSELYNGCERHDATCGPLSSPSSIASILARGNHVSNDVSYPALQSTPTAARFNDHGCSTFPSLSRLPRRRHTRRHRGSGGHVRRPCCCAHRAQLR
jgi:hypothetical protein